MVHHNVQILFGENGNETVITNINAKFAFSITGSFFPGGSNRAKMMINGLTTMLYIKYSVKTREVYVLKCLRNMLIIKKIFI